MTADDVMYAPQGWTVREPDVTAMRVSWDNIAEVSSWVAELGRTVENVRVEMPGAWSIGRLDITLDNGYRISVGDWLVHVRGGLSVMSDQNFRDHFEPKVLAVMTDDMRRENHPLTHAFVSYLDQPDTDVCVLCGAESKWHDPLNWQRMREPGGSAAGEQPTATLELHKCTVCGEPAYRSGFVTYHDDLVARDHRAVIEQPAAGEPPRPMMSMCRNDRCKAPMFIPTPDGDYNPECDVCGGREWDVVNPIVVLSVGKDKTSMCATCSEPIVMLVPAGVWVHMAYMERNHVATPSEGAGQ